VVAAAERGAHVRQPQTNSGVGVIVGGGTSRAQPLQSGCSFRVTRCLGAHVPANIFGHVCSNTATALVAFSDIEQCSGKS